MLFNKGKQTRYLNRVTRNCLKLNKKTQTKLASSLTSIKKGLNCNMHIGVFLFVWDYYSTNLLYTQLTWKLLSGNWYYSNQATTQTTHLLTRSVLRGHLWLSVPRDLSRRLTCIDCKESIHLKTLLTNAYSLITKKNTKQKRTTLNLNPTSG